MVGKKYATIPWEMGVLSKILRLIPNWLFDKILASRKQKPRSGTAGTSKAENRPVSEKSPERGSDRQQNRRKQVKYLN